MMKFLNILHKQLKKKKKKSPLAIRDFKHQISLEVIISKKKIKIKSEIERIEI